MHLAGIYCLRTALQKAVALLGRTDVAIRLASCSNHCLRRAIDHPALSSSPSTLTFPYSLPPSETLTQIAGLLDCRRPQTFLLLNEEQEFREVVQPTSRLRREFITALIPSSQLASSCLRPPRLAEHFIPRALTDQRVFLYPISRLRRTQSLSFLQTEHCSRGAVRCIRFPFTQSVPDNESSR